MRLKTSLVTLSLTLCLGLLSLSTAVAQKPVPFKLAGTSTWDNLLDAFPSEAGPAPGATFGDGAGQASDFPVIGFVTLVAANGDKLETLYYGDLSSVSGSGTADFEFIGGSGRFENATGGGQLQAYFDLSMGLENVPMVVFFDGMIDY